MSALTLRWLSGCLLLLAPALAGANGAPTDNAWTSDGQGSSLSDTNAQNGPQTSDGDNAEVSDLIRILQNAYGNAIKHDTANPDSKATDFLLERASIRLSARILSAISTDACTSNEPDTVGDDDSCFLAHESLDLRNLTNILSYAARQLDRVGVSTGGSKRIETSETARAQSLEHLYRMTFALSKAYLDPSQSHAYLEAAHEQLEHARQHIQDENALCACSSKRHSDDLFELSELSDRLSLVRSHGDPR